MQEPKCYNYACLVKLITEHLTQDLNVHRRHKEI
jgi:hypothetical protein